MKLSINPKNIFRAKKTRSISRTDPYSFSSSDGSSSSASYTYKGDQKGKETPRTVLPVKEADMVVEVFKMMDKDGDGKITMEELEAVLRTVGGAHPPTREELAGMLSELDRDGDGCISLEEFTAVSSAFGPPGDSELRDTFNFFDADHDGHITAEELHLVFSSLGDKGCTLQHCREMISGVDKDGDGSVCFDEFTLMMEQQR